MKLFRRMHLRDRLTFSYILLLIVPLMLLGVYAQETTRAHVRENASRAIEGMTEKVRESTQIKLSQYEQIMRYLMTNSMLQTVYKNQFGGYYELYVNLSEQLAPSFGGLVATSGGEIASLIFYSERGLNTYGNHIRNADSVRGEAWFEEACAASDLIWHFEDGVCYAAAPVYSADIYSGKQRLGVLRMTLNTPLFIERYLSLGWEEYGMCLLLAGDARYARNMAGVALTEETQTVQGREYKLFSASLDNADWRLVYCVPTDTFSSVGGGIASVNLLLIVAALAALMLLSPMLTKTLLKGLETLRRTMRGVQATGELPVLARSEGTDEVSQLSNQFADMLDRVRALMAEAKETQKQIGDLEMAVLRAQIDPHFLYNALSLINWKAIKGGNEELSRAAVQLSTFYRTCLNRGRDMIAVRDEMENVRAYIAIQRMMHRDAFEASVDGGGIPDAAQTLNFILQPLVENAVVHGALKRREGGGHIDVCCAREDGALVFTVTDDGPGMTQAQLAELFQRKPNGGYGLDNVQQRITLKYGEGWGVRLASEAGRGVTAQIRLPYLEDEKSDSFSTI